MNKAFTDGKIFGREPVLFYTFIGVLINAFAEFGLDLSSGQQFSILAVTAALIAIITRQSVTPNVTAVEDAQKALYTEPPKQTELVPEDVAKA